MVAVCSACREPVSPDDRFCESCGTELTIAGAPEPGDPGDPDSDERTACVDCGGAAFDVDGYCERCGRLRPAATDHVELSLAALAGVTDRGLIHARNEDAMALLEPDGPGGGFAVVVCDGVSTSQLPDRASRVAADAAVAVLADALDDRTIDLDLATVRAVQAAQDAVAALPWDRTRTLGPPSCTYVSAVRRPTGPIVVASIGDTRAYWFAPGASARLSADDSWAAQQIARGIDAATAEGDARAHAITHWLGADAPELAPHLATQAVEGPGRLLVCSDGLWNYASAVEDLEPMVGVGTPLAAAQGLTRFALDRGGHDNITVVVVAAAPRKETTP